MSTAQRLIEDLRQESSPVDAGVFTLDAAKAAARFEAFRYVDRWVYLVPIVEGLRVLGATAIIEITTDGADLVIRAPGIALDDPGQRLRDLFGGTFNDAMTSREYAMRRIAVGLDMVRGLSRTANLSVELRGPDEAWLALLPREGPPDVRALPPAGSEIRIVIDAGFGAEVAALVADAHARSFEALRDAVRFATGAISINDVELDRSGAATVWMDERRIETDAEPSSPRDVPVMRAVVEATSDPPTLLLLSAGIVIDRHVLDQGRRGFVAVAPFERAQRDLSQMRVVRGQRFDAALNAAIEAEDRLKDMSVRPSATPKARLWWISRPFGALAFIGTIVFAGHTLEGNQRSASVALSFAIAATLMLGSRGLLTPDRDPQTRVFGALAVFSLLIALALALVLLKAA